MAVVLPILTFSSIIVICILLVPKECFGWKKPHIVIVVADDLGWNDVGFHGSNQIPTPNIDALAYSGVILQNYYVLPVCTPSRSALMTAIHPIHTGMQHHVLFGDEPWGLPLETKILPEYLKEAGYKTHAVGKWHLGHFKAEYTPERRGFDTHFGYWTGHQDYYDHTAQEKVNWGYDMRRGLDVSWESYSHYSTDLFTDESVRLIESHNTAEPMFLYLSHLAVHSANPYQPLEAPDKIVQKFEYIEDINRRVYAAMVWKLDESVGKVVTALDAKGMLKDSLIIFTTDNGGPAAGFNSNAASNWPLRGVKDTLWEGGVRGCAFVWSPNILRSRIVNSLMHIQDWIPTILTAIQSSSLLNVSSIDGHDMWSTILGKNSSIYDELVLNIDGIRNFFGFRKGDWKVISGQTWNGRWDSWYGPSGREEKYVYNITSVKESMVAKAMKNSKIAFPGDNTILSLRSNSSINCAQNFTVGDSHGNGEGKTHESSACNLQDGGVCLFNIASDPCEQINLASERADIRDKILSLLKKYQPVTPLNQPGDPLANPKYWNYTWTNWEDYNQDVYSYV